MFVSVGRDYMCSVLCQTVPPPGPEPVCLAGAECELLGKEFVGAGGLLLELVEFGFFAAVLLGGFVGGVLCGGGGVVCVLVMRRGCVFVRLEGWGEVCSIVSLRSHTAGQYTALHLVESPRLAFNLRIPPRAPSTPSPSPPIARPPTSI